MHTVTFFSWAPPQPPEPSSQLPVGAELCHGPRTVPVWRSASELSPGLPMYITFRERRQLLSTGPERPAELPGSWWGGRWGSEPPAFSLVLVSADPTRTLRRRDDTWVTQQILSSLTRVCIRITWGVRRRHRLQGPARTYQENPCQWACRSHETGPVSGSQGCSSLRATGI